MKKLLSIVFLLSFLCNLSLQAQDGAALVVTLKDGSTTRFLLNDKPRVTCSPDNITVTSTAVTMSFEFDKVQRFNYQNLADAVHALTLPPTFKQEGGNLYFTGLAPHSEVTLYTIEGSMAGHYAADDKGNLLLPLSSVASGIYLVKTTSETYKMMKR